MIQTTTENNKQQELQQSEERKQFMRDTVNKLKDKRADALVLEVVLQRWQQFSL